MKDLKLKQKKMLEYIKLQDNLLWIITHKYGWCDVKKLKVFITAILNDGMYYENSIHTTYLNEIREAYIKYKSE